MNRNKDTLKDLFNRLTLQEQNNVINFAYLYDDVRSLRHQLQQKENITKEIREYCLEKAKGRLERTLYDDILELLDKGE